MAQGFTFFCNEKGVFDCPVPGCTKSYTTAGSMYYHLSKTHVENPQNPHQTLPDPPQGSPSSTMQTAPVPPVPAIGTSNNNKTMAWPSSQIRKVSISASRTPSPLSQSQPLSIPHDETNSEEQQDWSESISWPPQTISLLKSLVMEAGLFTQNAIKKDELQLVFREFYKRVDFPTYKPPLEDERLWLLFQSKVIELQSGMLRSGELYQTKEGLKLSKMSQNRVQSDALSRGTGTPISTPPRTPSLPPDQQLDGLILWNSLDSTAQARLFHELIRTAKSPQSLISEWEEYFAEVRQKEPRSESIPRPASTQAHVFNGTFDQGSMEQVRRTPIDTPPPPQPSKPTDLNSLIELRLKEASLKRQRAKEAEQAGKESAPKKVRSAPN